ncbi:MAG TPA: ATP-binding protein [Terriglobales bacterium]|jgi:signal transduction histidine kinase
MKTHPKKTIESALRLRMVGGFAVAIFLIGILGLLAWQRAHVAAAEADLVTHTYAVMRKIDIAAEHLVATESNVRGFAMTGNKTLLAHYTSSLAAVRDDIVKLRQMTADNPRQQQHLSQLESQMTAVEAYFTEIANQWRKGQKPLSDQQIESGETMTASVRSVLQKMENEEQQLLKERALKRASARRVNDLATIAGSLAGIAFLLLAGAAVNRQIRISGYARAEITALNITLEERVEERTAALRSEMEQRRQAEEEIRKLAQDLEHRVEERTAELQVANKELEAFTYSVSHDLRAPLRHIAGFSKMLSEECGKVLSDEARHYLQRIQDGTHRMGALVDDLLSLTRIGRHEIKLQVTGLDSIVKDVISDLKPDIESRNIEWKIGSLPYVEADSALLKVVFQNLLSNAVKYTRPRTHATIAVGSEEIAGEQVVFVRDNGVGFNMKYADKLFGVFQRLHRAEDFEGTGVGLATVQRILQKHGGRIWTEAELDKGATFYFTLTSARQGEGKDEPQPILAGELS